jgi:hypothetical protein
MTDQLTNIRKFFRAAAIAFAIVFGLGLAVMLYLVAGLGMAAAQTGTAPAQPIPPGKEPATKENVDGFVRSLNADLDIKYNNLTKAMEATEKRMGDLQALLAVLAGVGTALGIAAGVSSYFNFKQLQGEAQKTVDDLNASYPVIARMDGALRRIVNEIGSRVSMFDGWELGLYADLGETTRQEILLSEETLAALDFFDYTRVPALRRGTAAIYVGLGRFYGSRYYCSLTAAPADPASLHRAIVYFNRALTIGDEHELLDKANADLGVFYCWQAESESDDLKKPEILRKARGRLEAARVRRSQNPASLLALAWIDRREDRVPDALRHLKELFEAVGANQVTAEEKTRYLYNAYFNRACYRALDSKAKGADEKKQELDFAIKDLEKAKGQAKTRGIFKEWLADLERELADGKDLALLKPDHAAEIAKLQDPAAV